MELCIILISIYKVILYYQLRAKAKAAITEVFELLRGLAR